jgi:hypothetical protein
MVIGGWRVIVIALTQAGRLFLVPLDIHHEAFRHLRDGFVARPIANWTRSTGPAAATGSRTFPRPVGMDFTHPARIVAAQAKSHAYGVDHELFTKRPRVPRFNLSALNTKMTRA